MLLVLLLVLAFVPRITVSVPHRCFSTSCSSRVCIRVCQTNEPYCHVRFSPNNIRQLIATDIGCGNTSQSLPDVSTDHSIPTFPIPEYSCKGDLCNRVDGLTDSIQPLLEIPLNLPKDPLPQPHKGMYQPNYSTFIDWNAIHVFGANFHLVQTSILRPFLALCWLARACKK